MSETLDAPRAAPSLQAGLGWLTAVVRHAGWWLEWQMRNHAGEGCRPLEDVPELAPAQQDAA
jgi:hypothetical protein